MGGFFFAVLLCFKHLFAVAAPVYFVYLLRHYCWGRLVRGFGRLSLMGAVVAAIFSAAYLPFLFHGQVPLSLDLEFSPSVIVRFRFPLLVFSSITDSIFDLSERMKATVSIIFCKISCEDYGVHLKLRHKTL